MMPALPHEPWSTLLVRPEMGSESASRLHVKGFLTIAASRCQSSLAQFGISSEALTITAYTFSWWSSQQII